jgi:hypothetical protein
MRWWNEAAFQLFRRASLKRHLRRSPALSTLCAPDRVGRALQVPFNLDCLLAIHDAPFAPLGAVSYVFE